jgi:hypothetical protein
LVNALGILAGIWLIGATIVLLDWLGERRDRNSRHKA